MVFRRSRAAPESDRLGSSKSSLFHVPKKRCRSFADTASRAPEFMPFRTDCWPSCYGGRSRRSHEPFPRTALAPIAPPGPPVGAPDPVPRRSRAGGIFWLCSELLPWNVHHQQATPSPSGCFLELCWKHVRRLPLGRSCLIDRCASFTMSAAKSLTRCSTQDIISSGGVLRCRRDPCPHLRLLQPVNQDIFRSRLPMQEFECRG
ncbi:hypothetical protein B0T14DRAFT_203020 [Immersiella caudata]|uniref:Uncharacterized protein n=1 Tax=Immersiella caudata TaxID=314043 RepID=A0AA39WPQ8_9PEZI|nr:hypothetical protein B0T14DRAFT_203020 [Immersiella caudata]